MITEIMQVEGITLYPKNGIKKTFQVGNNCHEILVMEHKIAITTEASILKKDPDEYEDWDHLYPTKRITYPISSLDRYEEFNYSKETYPQVQFNED